MPKAKTNKAVAKRVSVTKTGKVKRQHAFMRHLLVRRTRKQKRQLRKSALVAPTEAKTLKRMLGKG